MHVFLEFCWKKFILLHWKCTSFFILCSDALIYSVENACVFCFVRVAEKSLNFWISCQKIFAFLKERNADFEWSSLAWNGLIVVAVVSVGLKKMKKTWKNVYFWRRKWKNTQHGANFFMGTWTHSFFCQVIFRYFPVVILRFFAFAVFFGGVAFRFFHACDFVFFCDFRQFWTFRFSAPRAVAIASLEPLKRAWIELFNGSKLVINCADGVE